MVEENLKNESEKKEVKKPSKKNSLTNKIRENPWIISTTVLGVVLVIILIVSIFSGSTGLSADEAGEKLLAFYTAAGASGLTVDSVEAEAGLYRVNFLYQETIVPIYVTKDGSLAGPLNPIEVDSSDTGTVATEEIPQTSRPAVDMYVMSFCPYGNRAEDTMLPAYNLLKNDIDFNIHYIVGVSGSTVQSLHGQPEVDQNEREVCVLNEYGMDKFWSFTSYVNTNCGSDGSCWQTAASQNGIDASRISSCVASEGLNYMKQEAAATDAAGASGSPTLIINGVQTSAVYQYGNSEAYKEAICSAFTDDARPAVCDAALSGSTSTSTGGSC